MAGEDARRLSVSNGKRFLEGVGLGHRLDWSPAGVGEDKM
jgi:hypothetical protein